MDAKPKRSKRADLADVLPGLLAAVSICLSYTEAPDPLYRVGASIMGGAVFQFTTNHAVHLAAKVSALIAGRRPDTDAWAEPAKDIFLGATTVVFLACLLTVFAKDGKVDQLKRCVREEVRAAATAGQPAQRADLIVEGCLRKRTTPSDEQ